MLAIFLLMQTLLSLQENKNRSWTAMELFEYSYKLNENLSFYNPNSLRENKTKDLVLKLSKYFPEINLKVFLINSINPIEYWDDSKNLPDINTFLKEFFIIINKEEQNHLFCVYSLDDKIKICQKDKDVSEKNFNIINKRLNYIIGNPFVSLDDIRRNQIIHHSSFYLYCFIIFCFFSVMLISCCINCKTSSEFKEKEDMSLSTITTSSDKKSEDLREMYNNQKNDEIMKNSFNLFSKKI